MNAELPTHRLWRGFSVATLSTFLFILLGAMPALAHHSQAIFDHAHQLTLTGTVREFQWSNPHCYIQLLVPVAGSTTGAVEEWSVETASPQGLLRLGWKRSSIQAGDKITVTIFPLRDGSKGGGLWSAIGSDSKTIGGVQ